MVSAEVVGTIETAATFLPWDLYFMQWFLEQKHRTYLFA
jgi:hypothetical protein